jgi:hypothetical protein
MAEFTTVTPLSLLTSRKLSVPIVGLKISSLPYLYRNLITKFLSGTSGIDPVHALVPRKSYPLYHHFHSQMVHPHSVQ